MISLLPPLCLSMWDKSRFVNTHHFPWRTCFLLKSCARATLISLRSTAAGTGAALEARGGFLLLLFWDACIEGYYSAISYKMGFESCPYTS